MVHNHLEYPTGHSESFRKRHFLKRRRTNLEMFSYLICLWERIYLGKASLENPKWCMRTPRQHAPSIQEWRLRSSKSCAHVCNPDPCCSLARLTDGAAFTAFGRGGFSSSPLFGIQQWHFSRWTAIPNLFTISSTQLLEGRQSTLFLSGILHT